MIEKIMLRAFELEKSMKAKPLTPEVLKNRALYLSYLDVIIDLGYLIPYSDELKRRKECQEEL